MNDTPDEVRDQITVLLIHGTFARNAEWCRDGSIFRSQLQHELGTNASIEAFNWSGWNFGTSRLRGATLLTDRVREIAKQRRQLFIIAHSHGGNVVRYAMRDPTFLSQIRGVVTLGTPFLRLDARRFRGWLVFLIKCYAALGALVSFLAVLGLFGGAILLVGMLTGSTNVMRALGALLRSEDAVKYALLPAAFGAFAVLRAFWLGPLSRFVRRLSTRLALKQAEIVARLDPPCVDGVPLLVCKTKADEAGFVVGATANFVEWFILVLREQILTGALLFIAVPIISVVAIFSFFHEYDLLAFPFVLLAALFSVPLGVLCYLVAILFPPSVIGSLGLGIETPLETWLVRSYSTRIPENWANAETHEITLPPRSSILFGRLRHSLIHENISAAELCARWINRTLHLPPRAPARAFPRPAPISGENTTETVRHFKIYFSIFLISCWLAIVLSFLFYSILISAQLAFWFLKLHLEVGPDLRLMNMSEILESISAGILALLFFRIRGFLWGRTWIRLVTGILLLLVARLAAVTFLIEPFAGHAWLYDYGIAYAVTIDLLWAACVALFGLAPLDDAELFASFYEK